VNFSHPCVNCVTIKSNVQIEQPEADQIHGDVEVLEAPCGDGVWHIEWCPPYVACLMFHIAKNLQTFLCYKDNYQTNFYYCPYPNYLSCGFNSLVRPSSYTSYGYVQMTWINVLLVQSANMHSTNWLFQKFNSFKLKPISCKMKSSLLKK
jgi:hypothetical protein